MRNIKTVKPASSPQAELRNWTEQWSGPWEIKYTVSVKSSTTTEWIRIARISWLWLTSFVTFSVPQFHLENEDVIMAATLEGYDHCMWSSLGKACSTVLGTYQAFTNLTNPGVSFSFQDALYILLTFRYPLRTWRNKDSLSTPPASSCNLENLRGQSTEKSPSLEEIQCLAVGQRPRGAGVSREKAGW